jgi:putative ABC transport system permease protein
MLSSYLRTAIRSLRKRPGYAFLNGFGLSLGLACFLLIGLFVTDELRFDRHHDDAERIVRVGLTGFLPNGNVDRFSMTSPPVGEAIRADIPMAESVVRLQTIDPSIRVGTDNYEPEDVWVAEPDLFDVFTLPLLDSDAVRPLEEPATAVLSRSTARQFFGEERAVGKYVVLEDTLQVRVTGVMEDMPRTSHMNADFIVSWSTYEDQVPTGWLNVGQYTYVKLQPGVAIPAFADAIRNMANERNEAQFGASGFRVELEVEPLTDIYLHSTRGYPIGPLGDMTQVWIFGAVALFVLLLAIINFTNLATARSMERAREVGIRKVVGSSRGALVAQFLGESVVMAVVAFGLSLVLMGFGLSVLNAMAGKEIAMAELYSPGYLGVLFVIALVAGLLGGLYPAVVMSGFESVSVLKGSFHSTGRGALLRKVLVSFQFAISIALVAGTVIVMKQLDFMQNQDLGFDQDRMLVVGMQNVPADRLAGQTQSLLDAFSSVNGVTQVSSSSNVPGRGSGRVLFGAEGVEAEDIRSANFMPVGFDYFDNYGIEMVAGRNYSRDFPSDPQQSVVVSESMVDYLGWGTAEEAIGKWLSFGNTQVTVVGVAADYHHASLKQAVEPMIFPLFPGAVGYLSLKLAAGDIRSTREAVEAKWSELFPAIPFNAFFQDADFNTQYEAEERLRGLFTVFAFLAILIACLGLIGLAAFTAQQRTKEIGVRKVLGASVTGIVALLSREFAMLVGIGFLIAVPAAVYGMDLWLGTFPYRTGMGVLPFLVAGLGALMIALLSVGWQASRAASINPVRALRSE